MKTIIAGGRNYFFTPEDKQALNELLIKIPITEVVSGDASGADRCGEIWANSHSIPVKKFPADWNKFGKAAGFKRNKQMAEYAEAAILFPGGRGTTMMFNLATEHNLLVFDFRDGVNI